MSSCIVLEIDTHISLYLGVRTKYHLLSLSYRYYWFNCRWKNRKAVFLFKENHFMTILSMIRVIQYVCVGLAILFLAIKYISYTSLMTDFKKDEIRLPFKALGRYSSVEIDTVSSRQLKRFMSQANWLSSAFWVLALVIIFLAVVPRLIGINWLYQFKLIAILRSCITTVLNIHTSCRLFRPNTQ